MPHDRQLSADECHIILNHLDFGISFSHISPLVEQGRASLYNLGNNPFKLDAGSRSGRPLKQASAEVRLMLRAARNKNDTTRSI